MRHIAIRSITGILLITFLFFQGSLTFAQNHDAELVSQETNITVKNGKLYKTQAFEVKIYNRAGEKFTKVTIPYSKMDKVLKIEAYIKDKNDIIIRKLKKSEITDRSAISNISFYEDDFVKEFTLKHNTYPYSIFYSYQVLQEEFLYIDYWQPVIDQKTPTLKATLHVEIPKKYSIFFKSHLIDEVNIDSSDLQIKYTWKTSYKDVIGPEIFSPPIHHFQPAVVIVPQEFKYDLEGSFGSWLTYGDWQYKLIKDLSDLPQGEENRILFLVSGIENEREKIKKLYHYLQDNTRYINIKIETGGLKPYPASYVAENKYGDCKALTNYFKSVLDFVGIQSYYTKVYAGETVATLDKNFPSQQFNHVILCIPVKNDTIWLDCTSDLAFNYLGTFTQNRDVFIIDKNNSHFTRTPSLSEDHVLEMRTMDIYLDQQNDAIANFYNTYRGETYEKLLYLSHSYSESKKSQIIRNNLIENGFEVIDFNLVESHRDSLEIYLSYSARSNKVYNRYGNEYLIHLLPFSIPPFEEPKDRKLPVQLDYPIYKIDTLQYLIPDGYDISNTLKDQTILNEFGQYKIEFNQKNNKMIVIKSFLLHSGYYAKDVYKNFYDFINGINEIENHTYIVIIKKN